MPPELLAPENPTTGLQCTPLHPLEEAAAELVKMYLNIATGSSSGWPWERLQVRLDFGCNSAEVFAVDLARVKAGEGGRNVGLVALWLHYGYLAQNPRAVMEIVVPRMVGETVSGLSKSRSGSSLSANWHAWFERLTGKAPSVADDPAMARAFWRPPMEIMLGARAAACSCQGRARWHAVASDKAARIAAGADTCQACKQPRLLCEEEKLPQWIRDELAFMRRERNRRAEAPVPADEANKPAKRAPAKQPAAAKKAAKPATKRTAKPRL